MAEIEVQTTIFANPIRVDEAEAEILRAQGLIADAPAPGAKPAPDGAAADKPEPKEPAK